MAVLVYLVRHGETDWNRGARIQGQQDIPLNELGRRQAEAVAGYLKALRFGYDCIYCSDLARARETAEIIAAQWGVEVVPRRDLRERNFGKLEGTTFQEARETYADLFRAYAEDPINTRFPDGESTWDLAARAKGFLEYLRAEHSNEAVMVVTHGGFIRTLLALVLGLPLEHRDRLEVTNAGVSVVRLSEDGDKVLAVNVTHHLAKVF
ncbi:MAG: histidine phosphatase family protein [Firmicutes bacterium]|nr:histidine phosphatase family protein [Bacillota bacterium]